MPGTVLSTVNTVVNKILPLLVKDLKSSGKMGRGSIGLYKKVIGDKRV